MTPFAEGGATAAASIAEVADADIISVTVLDDAQVREVVAARLDWPRMPSRAPSLRFTPRSVTPPRSSWREELKPQGIHIADAPVSGGGKAADKGELAVMVGADDETFERIKEPFSRWASVVIHAGEPGDGTKMKLARNMLTFIIYSAVGESQKLADEAGLNLNDLAKVVRHSDALTGGASSIMYRERRQAAGARPLPVPALPAHPRARREGSEPGAGSWGSRYRLICRLPRLALETVRGQSWCAAHRHRITEGGVMDELRRKGLEKMNEVYGWEMPNIEGDAFFDLTVDHLFGDIWNRPGLSMRDKRIMTLTAVTAVGTRDLAEIQINAALLNGELTETELKEMAVFLTHYLGFPLGSALNGAIGAVVAKRKKAAAKGAGEDKKANVDAALKMNAGKTRRLTSGVPRRFLCELDSRAQPQLVVDVAQVRLHGARGYEQARGNVFVRQPFADESHHVEFRGRQRSPTG